MGLAGSLTALTLAPTLMPASYSWVSQTTSESAAQGVEGAWLARLGFLLFGLSVLWLGRLSGEDWGAPGTLLHGAFGVLMIAAAVFSHRPWEDGVPFDATEDLLHSIAATAMGFAFAFGVVAVALRHGFSRSLRPLDVLTAAAAVILPLGISALPDQVGLLQRLMLLVAYVWYAFQALRLIIPFGRSIPDTPEGENRDRDRLRDARVERG